MSFSSFDADVRSQQEKEQWRDFRDAGDIRENLAFEDHSTPRWNVPNQRATVVISPK